MGCVLPFDSNIRLVRLDGDVVMAYLRYAPECWGARSLKFKETRNSMTSCRARQRP